MEARDVLGSADAGRDPRLAYFASGGELDGAPPSARVLGMLECLSLPCGPDGVPFAGATHDEAAGMLAAITTVESHASALKLALVREIIRRHAPGPPAPPSPASPASSADLTSPSPVASTPPASPASVSPAAPGRAFPDPGTWRIDVLHEIAAVLRISVLSAGPLADLAWQLHARLPGTGDLLDAGVLSFTAAKIIAEEFSILDDAKVAEAEKLLLEHDLGADDMTPGKIRRLCQKIADTVDPHGAAKRRERRQRDEARVQYFRDHGGAAALYATGLPPDAALMSEANVQKRATEYRKAGIREKMDVLRVLALADFTNGVDVPTRYALWLTEQEQRERAGEDDPGRRAWQEEQAANAARERYGDRPPFPDEEPPDLDDRHPADEPQPPGGQPVGTECPGEGDCPADGCPVGGGCPPDGDCPAGADGPGGNRRLAGAGPDGPPFPDEEPGDLDDPGHPGDGGHDGPAHDHPEEPPGPGGSSPGGIGGDGPGYSPGSGSGPGDGDDPGGGSPSRGGVPSGGDGPGGGGPGGGNEPGNGNGPGGGGPRGGGNEPGSAGTGPAPAGMPDPGLPALINLTLPLATVLGQADRPGEAPGYGSLDPALTRKLADAAAQSPRSRFCVTLTDEEGHATAHGCARRIRDTKRKGRPIRDTGRKRRSGSGNGTRTETGPPGDARDGPPGTGWDFVPDTLRPGPSGGYGNWILTLPSGARYRVEMHEIPLHECDHRHAADTYRPGSLLRHLVQVRDGECTFSVCSHPARESDFEHTTPHHEGGPTCACNGAARSRRCHRVKQSPHWNVTQPKPGWHRWEAPSGRSYTKGPKSYPS